MTPPRHEMILASAGSGKTYALTHRVVQLLANGAAPERIVALTFTRKAAGEFFDEILKKLARAATGETAARRLADDIGAAGLGRRDFAAMLRTVVDAMPRLSLGTLDAFFARIVRAFPIELGLGGSFELLEEHAARLERRRALRRLFGRGTREPDPAQLEFIEAFKRATFGVEEKQLVARLDRFLDQHQEIHLAAPDLDLWGNPGRIWPEGCAWLPPGDRARAAAAMERLVARRPDLTDGQRERWAAFFAGLAGWNPGAPLPEAVDYLLVNVLKVWGQVHAGTAEVVVDKRKLSLDAAECSALARLVGSIVGAEFQRRLEITRGLHAVLESYDRVYDSTVRRAGRLTFADVQRVLERRQPPGLGVERPQTPKVDPISRELIDWRLDARFDHWLLDEFQDTSHGQWNVLRNLVDEVIQDDSGRRSFFYVGDVKQAIYGWREGDSRLFREILDRYNAAAPVIAERHLDQSYRSGPAVLDLVNRVFGDPVVLRSLFPDEPVARWSRDWRPHTTSNPDLRGQAAWLHAEDAETRFRRTLEILQEIRPIERGLQAAVLVQKNEVGTQLADYLRREGGLPAVAESDLHVGTDNPCTVALLALLKAAAHPGDLLAWEHARMSPLRAALEAKGLATRDDVSRHLLREIHARGFERTLEDWLARLEPALAAGDTFSRERGRQMLAAARLFDHTGGRDVAEFIAFMEDHTLRDADLAGVVRVLTIHKAKGLGFDLVILPDLEGHKLATRRDGLGVDKTPDREVRWVYDLPNALFREHDPVLAAHVRTGEGEACYEKLALLYVAMTRARRGLYVITKAPGSSKSHNFPKLLDATLGAEATEIRIGRLTLPGGFATGEPDWFAELRPPAAAESPATPEPPAEAASLPRVVHRIALRPSEPKAGSIAGASLFQVTAPGAAAFGAAVHAALAAVPWWSPQLFGGWSRALRARGIPDAAIAEARACLEAPELAAVFSEPPAMRVEVWRERAFEVILDGAWVTGVFDRVLVRRSAGGRADRATIYEFKTDRIGSGLDARTAAVARHSDQLALYRRAVSVLTGLPPHRIAASLVFTQAASTGAAAEAIVEVPAG